MNVLLAVAHGSRDPGSQEVVAALLDRVAAMRPGLVTRAAFIDNASPSVRTALRELAVGGARDVVVLPMLLTAAAHSKTDVAASVQAGRLAHPGLRLRYGRPLGPDPALVRVLARRLADAGVDARHPVLLVAGGSLDPDANSSVAAVARLLREYGGWPSVDVAFASTAQPSVPAALERLARLGHTHIALARYFLGPGHLPSMVERVARSAPGQTVLVSPVLGVSDELAAVLLARYDEAITGELRMGCDTCMYRVALPGRHRSIGAPLAVHRHPDDAT